MSGPRHITENIKIVNELVISASTSKGDLIVGTGSGNTIILSPGSNGDLLTFDDTQPGGMKWASGGNFVTLDTNQTITGFKYFSNGLQIGDTTNTIAGTIRYLYGRFEGYDGSEWLKFTDKRPSGNGYATIEVYRETTDSNWNELFIGGVLNSRIILQVNSVVTFNIMLTAISNASNGAGYQLRGTIKRTLGGTVSMVDNPVGEIFAEDAPDWDISISADDTNKSLNIEVNGAGDTVQWFGRVELSEIVYTS